MSKLTPMMQQYLNLKETCKDSLLMFRVGDFYEMFFEDAITASKALEITLTGKSCGLEKRAPMCGVPHHAVDTYVQRLVNKGFSVAICDQMEDPSKTKTLVQRDITRIITPGTIIENSILDETQNNYIASVWFEADGIYMCYADVSTGEFCVTDRMDEQKFVNEMTRLAPREIICGDSHMKQLLLLIKKLNLHEIYTSAQPDHIYGENMAIQTLKEHFRVKSLKGFGMQDGGGQVSAAGSLMRFLLSTQKNPLTHINKITRQADSEYMVLDSSTCRNLELTQTIMQGGKRDSLLWVLDATQTAGGARKLRHFLLHPLKDKARIEQRLDAVENIVEDIAIKTTLTELFSRIYDFERIISKISYDKLDARDCVSLKNSIKSLPEVRGILKDCAAPLLSKLRHDIDEMQDLFDLIDSAILDEPGPHVREGNIVKAGYDMRVDSYNKAETEGEQWLIALEQKEREETGIKNLKIGFNNVFGYYIEISKSNLSLAPYRYARKQTLTNGERFITEELKEIEDKILDAKANKNTREYEIFLDVRDTLAENIPRIQKTADAIAELDVLLSFATVSYSNGYTRPAIKENGVISLKDSKHPVIAKIARENFVPNDVNLNMKNRSMLLITGPNMSGKSTYMRQTGLIVLMAHIGCFLPAAQAEISVTDRIFTRVGASDDLASGQSTFMVEMNELANILNNATQRSLIILDEIGRGTSTVDGLSIAWASVEYIIKHIKAKTMFATHYHELIELENLHPQVKNCSVTVKEFGSDIYFLHKIVPGGTDKSFGIEVARLAGLPGELIENARKYLDKLQDYEISITEKQPVGAAPQQAEPKFMRALRKLDINSLTPIEAMNVLFDVKKELDNEQD